MQSITPSLAVALPRVPFLFSPHSLYARFLTLTDHRDPRGVRYPLAALLTLATLAKLAEQNSPRAIADWAQLRAPTLADLFALDRLTMPHATTWNRVFGAAIDPAAFSALVADFLTIAATPQRGIRKRRRRGQIALSLDGKTLRGTIPAGMHQGVGRPLGSMLAAYRPEQGITLIEVAVDGKENEIVTAPHVLSLLDVQGCVVTGDAGALWAGFAQRSLSRQIRRQGGDYLWCVKENQPTLAEEIATLFTTPPVPAYPDDFTMATRRDTGHGRYEERTLTASSLLVGYSDWPQAQQVFCIERSTVKTGGVRCSEVRYGVTSLPPAVADAERLLALVRGRAPSGQVGIENGLFYRRDVTLGEDRSLLRRGNGPQVLAILNDLTLGLLAREGHGNAAAGRRLYAAFPDHAFALLTAA